MRAHKAARAMMGIKQMLDALAVAPKGAVYAGAHHGEHVPELLACGFDKILLVEPNPTSAERLRAIEKQTDRVRFVPAALGDRPGPVAYWRAPERLDILNSIYEPDAEHFATLAARARTELRFEKTEVPAVTLDHLLEGEPSPFNLLYMNIQGAELAAIRGASAVLDRFDVIACEVDFVRRYQGAVLYDELEQHLVARGFCAAGLWRSEDADNDYGMACFVRARAGDRHPFASPRRARERRAAVLAAARAARARRIVGEILASRDLPEPITKTLATFPARAATEPAAIDRALCQLAGFALDDSPLPAIRAAIAAPGPFAFELELSSPTRFRSGDILTPGVKTIAFDGALAGKMVAAPRVRFGPATVDLMAGWTLDTYAWLDGQIDVSPLETDVIVRRCEDCASFLAEAAPEYLAWVADVTAEIFPIDGRTGPLRSRSSAITPGRISASLAESPSPIALAELLVHEASHQYFELARELGPVDDGTDATLYWSPAKKTGRPIDRILLAYHAWANLAELFTTCIERRMDPDGYAERALPLIREDMRVMTEGLERSPALTDLGRALWDRAVGR